MIDALQGHQPGAHAIKGLSIFERNQLDARGAEKGGQAELPKIPGRLLADHLGAISCRQTSNMIDRFKADPERREAGPQDRAQIIGRPANTERAIGH